MMLPHTKKSANKNSFLLMLISVKKEEHSYKINSNAAIIATHKIEKLRSFAAPILREDAK